MEYVVFGAGYYGIKACDFIGEARVLCFADTYRFNMEWYNKNVISFDEMVALYKERDDITIVVASENHADEMAKQLEDNGIVRYCVFPIEGLFERLPAYYLYRKQINLTLAQIFSKRDLSSFHRFGVYGYNALTPFVFMEIWEQVSGAEVRLISNDESMKIFGESALTIDEAIDCVDCIVVNVKRNEDGVRDYLTDVDFDKSRIFDIYAVEQTEPVYWHPELARYKDIHKGKRCFLIGTGPSLTVDDLNTLYEHKEICISCNKIYRVYDNTKWRADYIGLSDPLIIEECKDNIFDIPGEVLLADTYHFYYNKRFNGINYFHLNRELYFPNEANFSDDFTKGGYWGFTVIYEFGLQFAAYCGFKEIYLLGCDCSTVGNVTDKGNHFIDDYFREDEKDDFKNATPYWEKVFKAYEAAEKYSRKHGFRIFNATRGGNLEVFERVDFDSLFS